MQKPEVTEYAPYHQRYIDLINTDDIFSFFKLQSEETVSLFKNINEVQASFRYAEGKWMMKEVLAHIVDSERIFGYRALAISHGEKNPLPGFAENEYVTNGKYQNRSLQSLLNEYAHLSSANLELFKTLDDEMLSQKGTASGKEITAKAIIFVTIGHEKHHLDIIKTRYLKN
ncbi:MAG: DinB family protein [Ignavibacteriaceae bacterium]|nr:DinB family protein [Ignavibacteriaceae bacterium]